MSLVSESSLPFKSGPQWDAQCGWYRKDVQPLSPTRAPESKVYFFTENDPIPNHVSEVTPEKVQVLLTTARSFQIVDMISCLRSASVFAISLASLPTFICVVFRRSAPLENTTPLLASSFHPPRSHVMLLLSVAVTTV